MPTCSKCGDLNESSYKYCLNCGETLTPHDFAVGVTPSGASPVLVVEEAVTLANQTQAAPLGSKRCPFCAEEIKFEAIKCRFCGEMLPEQRVVQGSRGAMQHGARALQTARASYPTANQGAAQPMIIVLALIGCLVAGIASFLPWAEANLLLTKMQVSGIDGGDGWITLGGAVVGAVAAVALVSTNSRWIGVLVLASGIVVAGTALIDIGNYHRLVSGIPLVGGLVSLAYGIYLTVAGGVLTAVAGMLALVVAPRN